MTGKYPARMDATQYFGASQPDEFSMPYTGLSRYEWQQIGYPLITAPYTPYLSHDETGLARVFNEAGYATFFAGKWHLGGEEYWPDHHGFEINRGGCHSGSPPGGYFSPHGNPRLEEGPDGEYLPMRLANETINFIEASKGSPFFACLWFYNVHTPLMTTDELERKYIIKRHEKKLVDEWGREGDRIVRLVQEHPVYAGMVEAMDTAIGKVLQKLKELNLEEDTIVIFASDNGGLSTSEGHPTSNLPLRAGKGWLYEGGIRIPLIVRWSQQIKPGEVCESPVTSPDFYPSLLEMAGLPPRPEQHKDGKSFVPQLKGESRDRGPIFWHYPHYSNQGGRPSGAVRDGDWKLIEFFETGEMELYHLGEDVGEQVNLISRHPVKAAELYNKLVAFREETKAKMPSVNPSFSQL